MPVCIRCDIDQDITNFCKSKAFKTGYQSRCKACLKIARSTKDAVIYQLYASQKHNSKRRNHIAPPNYTKEQFHDWCMNQKVFHTLYDAWVASGYVKYLKPSGNRLDDYKPYTLDNLELVTFYDNERKGHDDRINGKNNKASSAVSQYDKAGKHIKDYHSIREAMRQTGINVGTIHQLVEYNAGRGNAPRYTAGGFIWKYS